MNDVLLFVLAFLLGAITVWFLEEGLPPSRYHPSRYQPRYESNQPRYESRYDRESRYDALDSTRCQPAYAVSAPYPRRVRRPPPLLPCCMPCDY